MHLHVKSILSTNYFKPLFQNGMFQNCESIWEWNLIPLQSDKQEITSIVYYKKKKFPRKMEPHHSAETKIL